MHPADFCRTHMKKIFPDKMEILTEAQFYGKLNIVMLFERIFLDNFAIKYDFEILKGEFLI